MKRCIVVLLLLAAMIGTLTAQPAVISPDGNRTDSRLWGNNVQITNKTVYAFDVDYRENGEMYVGFIYPYVGRDSILILKSSDGGSSWSTFMQLLANEHRKFSAIAVVCGDSALYAFMPQDTARGTMRDYLGKFGYASSLVWSNFSDTTHAPSGIITTVDADRSAGYDTLMLAYAGDSSGTSTGTAILRSQNAGASWLWQLSSSSARDPRVTLIKDRRWGVAFKSYATSTAYRKRTMVYLSNDGGGNFRSVWVDTTARDTLNGEPSITACRSTGRAVVGVAHYMSAGDNNVQVYRALDAGDTSFQMVLDNQRANNQHHPAVNSLRFGTGGWVDLAFRDNQGDSIRYFTSQYGDSGGWGAGQTVSDRSTSFLVGPKIAYCNDGSHNGPAVFYAGMGENGIYMNADWLTGVAGGYEDDALNNGLELIIFGSRISYKLPQNGKTSLKIYNLLGQEVRTLANGFKNSGVYSLQWNGRDAGNRKVASGVYLVRIECNGQAVTGKLLVLR